MATGQYVGIDGVARQVPTTYIGVNGVGRNAITGYIGVNGAARLFLAPEDGNVVLEVEKIASNTYANNTTYENEEFILLDIYPKTGGTVSVTYGGLTKTITDTSGAENPNAQQVVFGTFNGVTHDTTPASGELTIEGDYYAFGCGLFNYAKSFGTSNCTCITAVKSLGYVTSIPDRAFGPSAIGVKGCEKITQIKLPKSVSEIGTYAFGGCTGLKTITIPASIIETYAFNSCVGLTTITLQERVESIGDYAFNLCECLTSINIPASVKSIGINPWAACNVNNPLYVDNKNTNYKVDGNCLVEIDSKTVLSGFVNSIIPSYITDIGDRAFSGCTGLTNVNIPSSVESIGASAFNGCTGLTNVNIPSSVESIGGAAFNGCTGLTNVSLSEGLTIIDDHAFDDCTGLTTITIPASVTSIGDFVFSGCTSVTEIVMLSETPPTIGSDLTFPHIEETLGGDIYRIFTATIVVPKGCREAYIKAPEWMYYDANKIVEVS